MIEVVFNKKIEEVKPIENAHRIKRSSYNNRNVKNSIEIAFIISPLERLITWQTKSLIMRN